MTAFQKHYADGQFVLTNSQFDQTGSVKLVCSARYYAANEIARVTEPDGYVHSGECYWVPDNLVFWFVHRDPTAVTEVLNSSTPCWGHVVKIFDMKLAEDYWRQNGGRP